MKCRDVRCAWMEAFDGEGSFSPEAAEHAARCAGCSAFIDGARSAREAVRGLPLGAEDPAADRQLLAALERAPVRQPWWRRVAARLGASTEPASWRAALPLVGTGLASFAGTLLAAGLLSQGGAAGPGSPSSPAAVARVAPEGGAPGRLTPTPSTPDRLTPGMEARLDAWLNAPSLLPPRGPSAPSSPSAPAVRPGHPPLRGRRPARRPIA